MRHTRFVIVGSYEGKHGITMIVWLASYPRSGNTLFRLAFKELYGRGTFSKHEDWQFFAMGAADTIGHARLPKSLEELDRDPDLFLVKTHDLPEDERPAIYLVRDGRDAICSFAHFLRTYQPPRRPVRWAETLGGLIGLDPLARRMRHLITSPEPFGGWSGNVRAWLRRPRPVSAVVRYEELVLNPLAAVREAVDACDVSLSSRAGATVPSFESLRSRWPDFFRKGVVSGFRAEMSRRNHDLFWQYHSEAMEELGYKRCPGDPGDNGAPKG